MNSLSDVIREQRESAEADDAISRTAAIAEDITQATTPVVRVIAVHDRWRAKRFWPKGETELTEEECAALGEAGFEQLRADANFTVVLLHAAD